MKFSKRLILLTAMVCSFAIISPASSQDTGGSGSSNELFDGLMNILQEGIEEFIGNYKGSLGEVKLLERLGNKIVLEVTYDNVKRSDNVYVQGEVMHYGEKLEGFSNTLSSIRGSHGKAILSIGWSQTEDENWGTVSSEVQSDQVRLFLVRKSNPDRPFGEILYDMSKIWVNSDAPDEESMLADNDSIELEEGESVTENKPAPGVFVKPGTVLRPFNPAATIQRPATAAQSTTQPSPPTGVQSTVQTPPGAASQTQPAPPTLGTPVRTTRLNKPGLQSFDYYRNAQIAKWRSSAGQLSFPGRSNDPRGFVRTLSNATLSSGNKAIELVQMHPEFKPKGWIDGHFPAMVIGKNLHFKSIVGFLRGANKSDGATFQVYVKENNKYYRVANARVRANKYVSLDADLSRYAGKKIQIVLRVRAGQTSKQDWAVWVKPRLTK